MFPVPRNSKTNKIKMITDMTLRIFIRVNAGVPYFNSKPVSRGGNGLATRRRGFNSLTTGLKLARGTRGYEPVPYMANVTIFSSFRFMLPVFCAWAILM